MSLKVLGRNTETAMTILPEKRGILPGKMRILPEKTKTRQGSPGRPSIRTTRKERPRSATIPMEQRKRSPICDGGAVYVAEWVVLLQRSPGKGVMLRGNREAAEILQTDSGLSDPQRRHGEDQYFGESGDQLFISPVCQVGAGLFVLSGGLSKRPCFGGSQLFHKQVAFTLPAA